MFLFFLATYRDRNYVGAATSCKLTSGTGDQDDAIAFAVASNMTATDLDVSKVAVPRYRCQRLAHSHTLIIHGWITSLRSIGSEGIAPGPARRVFAREEYHDFTHRPPIVGIARGRQRLLAHWPLSTGLRMPVEGARPASPSQVASLYPINSAMCRATSRVSSLAADCFPAD